MQRSATVHISRGDIGPARHQGLHSGGVVAGCGGVQGRCPAVVLGVDRGTQLDETTDEVSRSGERGYRM